MPAVVLAAVVRRRARVVESAMAGALAARQVQPVFEPVVWITLLHLSAVRLGQRYPRSAREWVQG